jgi:hypothetical protein
VWWASQILLHEIFYDKNSILKLFIWAWTALVTGSPIAVSVFRNFLCNFIPCHNLLAFTIFCTISLYEYLPYIRHFTQLATLKIDSEPAIYHQNHKNWMRLRFLFYFLFFPSTHAAKTWEINSRNVLSGHQKVNSTIFSSMDLVAKKLEALLFMEEPKRLYILYTIKSHRCPKRQ